MQGFKKKLCVKNSVSSLEKHRDIPRAGGDPFPATIPVLGDSDLPPPPLLSPAPLLPGFLSPTPANYKTPVLFSGGQDGFPTSIQFDWDGGGRSIFHSYPKTEAASSKRTHAMNKKGAEHFVSRNHHVLLPISQALFLTSFWLSHSKSVLPFSEPTLLPVFPFCSLSLTHTHLCIKLCIALYSYRYVATINFQWLEATTRGWGGALVHCHTSKANTYLPETHFAAFSGESFPVPQGSRGAEKSSKKETFIFGTTLFHSKPLPSLLPKLCSCALGWHLLEETGRLNAMDIPVGGKIL